MPHATRRSEKGAARALAAILVIAAVPVTAAADIYGGGGSSKTDCLLVLETSINHPPSKPRQIRCTDGDPACDADGVVNGTCVFPTAVCVNSTYNPAKCTLVGLDSALIDHSLDNGDPDFDTEYQALQASIDNELEPPNVNVDDCTGFTAISVDVSGPFPGKACKRGKKKMRIESESIVISGKRSKDKDTLKMRCDPAPGMCDAQTLFSGTLDRIQNQIFDTSCALGGCHDSQANAGNLLLEAGTSHGALVDVDPSNGIAFAAGYKRVLTIDPMTGDPDASFLTYKLSGDLAPGMGERMPLGGKKISRGFREIVELWILAGAPATGWVPGTDQ